MTGIHLLKSSLALKPALRGGAAPSAKAEQANKALPPPAPGRRLFQNTSLKRLLESHLVRDRVTGEFYEIDPKTVVPVGDTGGKWLPVEKKHAGEAAVEIFEREPGGRVTYQMEAKCMGPVSDDKIHKLVVPFDEEDITHRLDVIC